VSKKSAKIAELISSFEGRGLDAHYLAYFECFNQGFYYEAHDVLEDLWLADRLGPNGAFYKGLIQLAGAFVHLQKGRMRPSAALFKLAEANLQGYSGVRDDLEIAGVLLLIGQWLGELERGEFAVNPLAKTNRPRIFLVNASSETRLVTATRNAHKVQEIRAILPSQFSIESLSDLPGAPEVVEDAATFAGNATKKAVALAKWLAGSQFPAKEGGYVLADDSGLEVDALNGAPGVYSARFAAVDSKQSGNTPDAENNAKLLRLLADVPAEERMARFRCVLALTPLLGCAKENASPVCAADEFEMETELFEGTCEGRIAFSPSGKGGFGYDPLFIPEGQQQSFAELGEEIKNRLSHRAKALAKLAKRMSVSAPVQ
jgi:XTP/dITP diphosphohydrolase